MKPSEIMTLAIAIVGAVLGIINTWRSIDRDRMKLRVSMSLSYPTGAFIDWETRPHLSIEVINQSPFELTIAQVGILQDGGSEFALFNPLITDGTRLPRRMVPRSSFTAHVPLLGSMSFLRIVKRTYARTDAGETVYSPRRESARVVKQVLSVMPVTDESQHGD
jgi:hypothetical protein